MNKKSTVTKKGQVTIPAEARKKLGIKPQDKVSFELTDQGLFIKPVKKSDLKNLYGSVSGDGKSVQDIREEAKSQVGKKTSQEGV